MNHLRRLTRRHPTPTPIFHLFPTLPPEIRLQIWELVCQYPRTLHIHPTPLKPCPHGVVCQDCYAYYRYRSNLPPPAILSVNSEARSVGLNGYKLEFGTISKWKGWRRVIWSPPRIYVNWEVDEIKVLAVGGQRNMGKMGTNKNSQEMNVRRPVRWLITPEDQMAIRIGLLGESCDDDDDVRMELFDCPFYQG